MPERIQRSRAKGWRMPDGAVYVGRPTRWGNPFMAETARVGIPEDLDFDPSYRRQRTLARYLLGIAINRMPAEKTRGGSLWGTRAGRADIREMALSEGLVWFDDWHHAPACPANNWGRQRLPEGPCTCGAERRRVR